MQSNHRNFENMYRNTGFIYSKWSQLCMQRESELDPDSSFTWMDGPAYAFVQSVLAFRYNEDAELLKRISIEWGKGNPELSIAMRRLSWLREILQHYLDGENTKGNQNFHNVIDYVMAWVSEAVIATLSDAAWMDHLTGCGNRRLLDDVIVHQLAQADRSNTSVLVAVVDLDGLKKINDEQGHLAGDGLLCSLVRSLKGVLRATDAVYRVGGDEFVVVFPFASADTADTLMDRAISNGAPSFSWGVSSYPQDGKNFEELFAVADENLYNRRRFIRTTVSDVVCREKKSRSNVALVLRDKYVKARVAFFATAVGAMALTVMLLPSSSVSLVAKAHHASPGIKILAIPQSANHRSQGVASPGLTSPTGSPGQGSTDVTSTPPLSGGNQAISFTPASDAISTGYSNSSTSPGSPVPSPSSNGSGSGSSISSPLSGSTSPPASPPPSGSSPSPSVPPGTSPGGGGPLSGVVQSVGGITSLLGATSTPSNTSSTPSSTSSSPSSTSPNSTAQAPTLPVVGGALGNL